MDKIRIRGGRVLRGQLRVMGAKNAALPLQCAALLGDSPTTLRQIPDLTDVRTMNRLLEGLGCTCQRVDAHQYRFDPAKVGQGSLEAPYERVKTMRASVTVMGPLLARFGKARVSLPGGCAIGARPIDQHLKGFEALGAEISLERGYVELKSPRLTGAKFVFDTITVGGTQNVMMAAALAKGSTQLQNVAREPEVQALAEMLNCMGAKIRGAGSSVIEIEGVDHLQGVDHEILPDRIEAGTFMVATAITGGEVFLQNAPAEQMTALIEKLRHAGVQCEIQPDGIWVRSHGPLKPVDVITRAHPGFPTDMQAQMMLLLTQAQGRSVVRETIFENRFMHVPELNRLGASIVVQGNQALVQGPSKLQGTTVMATDLRASASLVLAGLIASGQTEVLRVYHLDRGYEKIEERLRSLGADIERVPNASM